MGRFVRGRSAPAPTVRGRLAPDAGEKRFFSPNSAPLPKDGLPVGGREEAPRGVDGRAPNPRAEGGRDPKDGRSPPALRPGAPPSLRGVNFPVGREELPSRRGRSAAPSRGVQRFFSPSAPSRRGPLAGLPTPGRLGGRAGARRAAKLSPSGLAVPGASSRTLSKVDERRLPGGTGTLESRFQRNGSGPAEAGRGVYLRIRGPEVAGAEPSEAGIASMSLKARGSPNSGSVPST